MNTENIKEPSDGNYELYEHYNVTVDAGQGSMRIDKYLFNKLINISRNKVQQAAKAGNIIVNGESKKSNYKVRPLDVISVVMTFPPRDIEILPEDIPLNIVYEDEDIILVNKQAGLVVHPAYANYTGTLLNGLAYHFAGTNIGNVENGFGYLVHRIDKGTTGLMVIAKNELAQTKLAKQFFDHTVDRAYEALVWKDMEETEGTIEGNIGRSLKDRRVMTVFPGGEYGKHAVSHYKVLRSYGYVTHVECRLETGRTHQIRAHFTYLGHPLFNDSTYGGDKILKGTTFTKYRQFVHNCFKILNRQALHARSLGFIHPTTGKKMNFVSNLPEDMNDVLVKWEGYISNRPDEYN